MYYPMMVDIRRRIVLVIGGGKVAERKVLTLLTYGAHVRVVSPSLTDGLKKLAKDGKIEVILRHYQKADIAEAELVFVTTDKPYVNRKVYQDAVREKKWVNVANDPSLCNFTVPSTLRRGKLQISVSTSGASPALARRIRRQLEAEFDEVYIKYVDWLQSWRDEVMHQVADADRRSMLLKELAGLEVLELLRNGEKEAADALARETVEGKRGHLN